jgi:hypothetical protein
VAGIVRDTQVKKNVRQIDRYLKGIVPPSCVCDNHQQQLRDEVLDEMARQHTPASRQITWRLVAIISGIASGVGVVVGAAGLKIVEQRAIKPGMVVHDDMNSRLSDLNRMVAVEQPISPDGYADRLVKLIESELKGRLDNQRLTHEYPPPERREVVLLTPVRNTTKDAPTTVANSATTVLKPEEKPPLAFKRVQYTLPDGTRVTLTIGEPNNVREMR